RRFDSENVRRFGHDSRNAVRPRKREPERDDRAVAVSPEDGPVQAECVEKGQRFGRRALMKIGLQLVDRFGSAVASPIGNHNSKPMLERGNLSIEWVALVAPPTVEEQQRTAASSVTIVNNNGRDVGSERRRGKLNDQL